MLKLFINTWGNYNENGAWGGEMDHAANGRRRTRRGARKHSAGHGR